MLKIKAYNHNYSYEITELLKVFQLSGEVIPCTYSSEGVLLNIEPENSNEIISKLEFKDNKIIVATVGRLNEVYDKFVEEADRTNDILRDTKLCKLFVKRGIYALLKKLVKKDTPWGILTGIRPTKLVHEMLKDNLDDSEIIENLKTLYFIAEHKANLLLQVAKTEYKVLYPIDDNKISLYVSVPFCPTKCTYCSFPSNPMKKAGHLTETYVDRLCEEIEKTAKLDSVRTKDIDTVYIGGGTPSSLTHTEIEKILDCLKNNFNLTNIREYTFEAGRPETITFEKLKVFKGYGVTRISINPQTMNDCTLEHINREHRADDIVKAYNMAKEAGFNNINMDIIIGLPNENIDMLKYTMEQIKNISPTNITVHTLAIKRASNLKENNYSNSASDSEILDMIQLTMEYANSMGLNPYYLYRQKHMVGNLENIGYCKPGYEGIYNIQIMEEKQTIIAFGAGAVTKIVFNEENRLERVPNVKSLEHYLDRVDEMVERKRKILEGIVC
ncbi:coproporphyrinogen dehydrogenase HemZ [Serpentinicella alkaliphila]|uniref:Oxygen-independent coproporphyrinogen-3 oxidase n=1 Tax=Serpentinicella alkaliphila TaxID=1734049 RepID=A0A4R2TY08_9FIRM|nr:coproporphyrinogen dehydrogenase HemZ [Serpentinicella alkaliphila]QUH26725.1 coproporphyrinogen dehydrogenase HemZ [Serpentinicella alkaliphila]TCQ07942.1 oxygen-independent coproporphyrinogen-3 oxidase [Serpentinicella alkaliphila]